MRVDVTRAPNGQLSIETAASPTARRPWRRTPRPTQAPSSTAPARRASATHSSLERVPASPASPADGVPFDSLGLHPDIVDGVAARGFKLTTPIQTQVIPVAREGRDIIACAETGTGKTAAFVLPILDRLIRTREAGVSAAGKTRVLVLAPTRELAVQVDDDITGFAYHSGIRSAVVCGGLPSEPQERGLRAGVDIVVATPGRLMDHMRCGVTDFSALEVLVLDEADRMLDMGFWPDIQKIVESLPTERQTLLLSATIAGDVVKLANAVVKDAKMIGQPRANQIAPTISHATEEMPAGSKTEWLARFLRREQGPILVFVRTKRGADRLADRLKSAGVRCAALHADLSQAQRTSAMEGFRAGRFRALVATDLAARGLDIRGITHVVNFEVPSTKEAYVHRVGRTGRADATGTAITLVSPEERRALAALEREVGMGLSGRN
jgi:ATP-dependent RNA helicase RhlE